MITIHFIHQNDLPRILYPLDTKNWRLELLLRRIREVVVTLLYLTNPTVGIFSLYTQHDFLACHLFKISVFPELYICTLCEDHVIMDGDHSLYYKAIHGASVAGRHCKAITRMRKFFFFEFHFPIMYYIKCSLLLEIKKNLLYQTLKVNKYELWFTYESLQMAFFIWAFYK